jgi:hypothetical protein
MDSFPEDMTFPKEPHLGIIYTRFKESIGDATDVAVTQLIEILKNNKKEAQRQAALPLSLRKDFGGVDRAIILLGIMGQAAKRAGPVLFQYTRDLHDDLAQQSLLQIHGIIRTDFSPKAAGWTWPSWFDWENLWNHEFSDYHDFICYIITEFADRLYEQSDRVPSLDDKIKEVKALPPEDYDGRAAPLAALNAATRRVIAAELAPALNAKAQAMPHDTYEQKKALARWVNEELRRFDLAIKGPTGQPSILLVGTGKRPEIGVFILEHRTSDGKRLRPLQTASLPHLELMEANPRREAFIEWRERVASQREGASRA